MCRLHGLKHANSKNMTSRLAKENGIETESMVQAPQDGGKVRSFVQALFVHASALDCRHWSLHWLSCAGYFQFHESPAKVDKWMDLRKKKTCLCFTGEDYGFTYELGRLEVSIGKPTFCRLPAEQILLDFATASSKSESTSFSDHFTLEYYAQFLVAVGYAMFFVGVAVVRVVNSVYQKDTGLDSFTSGLHNSGNLWNMLPFTMLAGHLDFPMGSVRTLPVPPDKIVLVRTPPDYGAVVPWPIVCWRLLSSWQFQSLASSFMATTQWRHFTWIFPSRYQWISYSWLLEWLPRRSCGQYLWSIQSLAWSKRSKNVVGAKTSSSRK